VAASPTMRRRRLAAELRRLRTEENLTAEQVAAQLGWQPSKLSRIENRQTGITISDLRKLLDLYKVDDRRYHAGLLDMARRASERGWWQSYGGGVVPEALATLIGLEEEARTVRGYEPELVPGLLQTEAYARAVMRAWGPARSPADIDRRIEVRLGRQQVLEREDAPQVSFILNEAVLRRPVGGHAAMREQIDHLAQERQNVVVQILPFDTGPHPAMTGPFQMVTFHDADDLGLVYVEGRLSGYTLERPEQIREYDQIWGALQASALSPEDSRVMMKSYALIFSRIGPM
jgi:transcriptional regulator with XRE-family HTH domain